MSNQPVRFSQNKIWHSVIEPDELEDFVEFVKEEKYESWKKDNPDISKGDIRVVLHLFYDKVESDSRVKATIDVQTIIIPESSSAFYEIAKFSEVSYAKETFKKMAKYKGAKIIQRDKEFLARREFEWT